jgi:hypothetical protein
MINMLPETSLTEDRYYHRRVVTKKNTGWIKLYYSPQPPKPPQYADTTGSDRYLFQHIED